MRLPKLKELITAGILLTGIASYSQAQEADTLHFNIDKRNLIFKGWLGESMYTSDGDMVRKLRPIDKELHDDLGMYDYVVKHVAFEEINKSHSQNCLLYISKMFNYTVNSFTDDKHIKRISFDAYYSGKGSIYHVDPKTIQINPEKK